MAIPDNLEELTLEELEKVLINTRMIAVTKWPYAGTNDQIRAIEAEYKRRGEALPEERE
jgi:hypothetical protein